jgi:Zn ribbon nucleic-acid-binding protein
LINLVDFLSKDCRNNNHVDCYGKWQGLGIEAICCCKCGHNKKEKALELLVGEPAANAIQRTLSNSKETVPRI